MGLGALPAADADCFGCLAAAGVVCAGALLFCARVRSERPNNAANTMADKINANPKGLLGRQRRNAPRKTAAQRKGIHKFVRFIGTPLGKTEFPFACENAQQSVLILLGPISSVSLHSKT